MPHIPEHLRRTAAAQDGLVTRQQARDAGLTRHQIDWLVRADGRWRVVLRGVYSVTSGALTRRQQYRAAVLYVADGVLLTGPTVMEMLGLRYAPTDRRVHVLVPNSRRLQPQRALVVERTRHLPPMTMRDGLPTASVARAAVDAARRSSRREARAVLAEVVQRRLTIIDVLQHEIDTARSPGTSTARAALDDLGSGAASAPELDLLAICQRSCLLPAPSLNHPLSVDGVRVVADACWPEARLIIEVDSTEHHGYGRDAEHTSRRRAALTAAGWTVVSVSPARLRDDPDGVLRDIEAAYLTQAATQLRATAG